MSTQNEAILSKLDKVIDEQHSTNKLLTEVIADNRHRDARIDELEATNVGLRSELDEVIMWKVKNEDPIKKAVEATEKYQQTWEENRDNRVRKKDAMFKYAVWAACTISVAVATYVFKDMQDAREYRNNAKAQQVKKE